MNDKLLLDDLPSTKKFGSPKIFLRSIFFALLLLFSMQKMAFGNCDAKNLNLLIQETVLEESKINDIIECGVDSIDPLLISLFDENESIRVVSVRALQEIVLGGSLSGQERVVAQKLNERLVKKEESVAVREYIVVILGNLGKSSEIAVPTLIKLLSTDEERIREVSAFALGQIKIDKVNVINALILSLSDESPEVQARSIQSLGKWSSEIKLENDMIIDHLLKKLKSDKKFIRLQTARALEDFSAVIYKESKTLPQIQNAINTLDKIRRSLDSEEFRGSQESVLRDLRSLTSEKKSLSQEIQEIQAIREKVFLYVSAAGNGFLLHVFSWLSLVALYPRSPRIQAIFFWNPKIRRFLGAGYVGPLLVLVPLLRRKLLEPFRESLLADANLSNFNAQSYFQDLRVLNPDKEILESLSIAIPQLRGQIILEGKSGLGKTMFLRHLCKDQKKIVVYLLARRCQDGVIEAIRKKLYGEEIKDQNLLRQLIYSGTVAICIDGLNEVNADTRAKIVEFAENYFKGDIILSTQPMDWRSPTTAKKYVMQPLDRDQIQAFLLSRAATLPHNAKLTGKDYEEACIQYLADMLGQPKPELEAMQRILSNPMDLSTIALMLAAGEWPQPFGLQKQLYDLMAKVYEEQHLCPFPLEAFSEVVYQMRLDDKAGMVEENFRDEISCLAQHRMMVPREVMNRTGEAKQKWYFRHDKIAEFFILQALIAHPDRQKQHLSDPRFRGVYFMLASFLDLEDAKCLRELLIQHAADTKDHTVSDEVIQLLREREGAIAGCT